MMFAWHPQVFALKFRVSDLTLWSMQFRVLARVCSLREVIAGVPDEFSPASLDGCEGVVLRSCPGERQEHQIVRDVSALTYVFASYSHCYIDMSGTFEEYTRKFSSKSRSTVHRKVKKFTSRAGVQLFEFRHGKHAEEYFSLARRVSRLTYQERLLNAGFPDSPEFFGALATDAEHNRVRGFVLVDGDRPVAYLHCPVHEHVLLYGYLGYDPEYAEFSVGTVLFWLALERLFAERLWTHFDFTEGEGEYKRFYGTNRLPAHHILRLLPSLRRGATLRAHRLFESSMETAASLAERAGVRRAFRKMIRRPRAS